MSYYEVVAVARIPQAENPPTFVEVDRIIHNGLSYEYGFVDGNIQVGCNPQLLSEPVKARLRELDKFPTELWLYKDDKVIQQAAVTSLLFQGQTLSMYAHGIRYYLRYMYLVQDYNPSNVDQFEIANTMVNRWQSLLAYGHFGIDIDFGQSSPVDRTRDYLWKEIHNVHRRIGELSQVNNGFDWWVDGSNRKLTMAYPQKGVDLTDTVFLDHRNITQDNVHISVQQGDIASVGVGGSSFVDGEGGQQVLGSFRQNFDLSETFGAVGIGQTWQDIKNQSTLDGHVDKLLDERDTHLLALGPDLIPVAGVTVEDFDFGDTVMYSYDYGLGLVEMPRRVLSIQVSISGNDDEKIGVRFA